ncbi:MAG: TolC family protein [bacterium]
MKRLSLVCLLLFSVPVLAQEPDQTPNTQPVLTLEDALKQAQKASPSAREQAAKVRKAEWQQFRADYAWAPKIQSTFAFSLVPAQAEIDDFSSNWDQYLDFQFGPYLRNDTRVIVPLYTFNRIGVAQDLAQIGVDVARLQEAEATFDTTFQVKRAYFTAQLSTAFAAILKEGEDIIKPKLQEMTEAREFGDASFSTEDYRKLQIFDAEFDGRVLDNQKLGDLAVDGVAYFTANTSEFRIPALSEDDELPRLEPLQTYEELARLHRTDLKLLAKALEARGLAVEKAKADFYPNFVFAASFGFGWSTEELALKEVCRRPSAGAECVDTSDLYARPYSNALDFLSFTVGLGLEWNIDVVQTYGKYKEADAELAETLAQRDRATGAIALDIRRLYSDAQIAFRKAETNARRLDAARRWRDQFGLSVKSAGADIAKGIDPLKAFFEARVALLQARYEYLVARAALAKGIGLHELP